MYTAAHVPAIIISYDDALKEIMIARPARALQRFPGVRLKETNAQYLEDFARQMLC